MKLNTFLQGYVDAALWSSVDAKGVPLDKNHTSDHIAATTLAQMSKNCQLFLASVKERRDTVIAQSGLPLRSLQ